VYLYDSTAKTFFTAKTAKKAKKFFKILKAFVKNPKNFLPVLKKFCALRFFAVKLTFLQWTPLWFLS